MNAVIAAGVPIGDPKLEDLLDVFARWLKSGINCIKIGTIQAIDYTKMTATIQIVFQQALRDGTFQNIPVLTDCPVFTLQGGGYSLQFPIEEGDTAIVLFSDRNIDNWFQSGGVQVPADGRLHSLSDAIAIVGINSLASPLIPSPLTDIARLIAPDGLTMITIQNGEVLITEAGGASVGVSDGGIVMASAGGGTSGSTGNGMKLQDADNAQVGVENGKAFIKNTGQSLATILDNLISTLINSGVFGSITPPSPTVTALNNIANNLDQLLSS